MSWRRLYESQSSQAVPGQTNILRSLPAIFQNTESQSDAIQQIQTSLSVEPWQTSSSKLFHSINYTSLQMLSEIQDPLKRAFYEHELIQGCWSTRQLDRQISTLYYERSVLSKDKEALKQHMLSTTHGSLHPHHYLRDPLTLEFLGIPETEVYTETKLEAAILDNLQQKTASKNEDTFICLRRYLHRLTKVSSLAHEGTCLTMTEFTSQIICLFTTLLHISCIVFLRCFTGFVCRV